MRLKLVTADTSDTRSQVLDAARAAGRLGADRLPSTVLFHEGRELSDTGVMQCLDALEAGQAERAQLSARRAPLHRPITYLEWMAEDFDRLLLQCEESGCSDGGKWLQQQFTIETGLLP